MEQTFSIVIHTDDAYGECCDSHCPHLAFKGYLFNGTVIHDDSCADFTWCRLFNREIRPHLMPRCQECLQMELED